MTPRNKSRFLWQPVGIVASVAVAIIAALLTSAYANGNRDARINSLEKAAISDMAWRLRCEGKLDRAAQNISYIRAMLESHIEQTKKTLSTGVQDDEDIYHYYTDCADDDLADDSRLPRQKPK
jgi:hypothetical protein